MTTREVSHLACAWTTTSGEIRIRISLGIVCGHHKRKRARLRLATCHQAEHFGITKTAQQLQCASLHTSFTPGQHMSKTLLFVIVIALYPLAAVTVQAQESSQSIDIWPKLAPGETTQQRGEELPRRPNETPPVTRVVKISYPTLRVYQPTKTIPNGVGVLILPGGGFGKVVPDMEGSEAATWLNQLGITAFVLSYRTNNDNRKAGLWKRPLQDSQRALRYIRANANRWKLDREKIGLLGFSAGGQVASIHMTATSAAYPREDAVDDASFRPDFALLIYPWNVYDSSTKTLMKEIQITSDTAPTFIVHTHDDRSTSLGAVMIYAGLKQHGVSAELHIYQSGGHGYGTRDRPKSDIGTWTDRGTDWLLQRGLGTR